MSGSLPRSYASRHRRDSRLPLLERHISDYGEMATEAIFDGPISESVPTSQTGFAHRVSISHDRADSSASHDSHALLSLQFFRSDYDEDRDIDLMSTISHGDFEEAIEDETASVADNVSITSSRRSSASHRTSFSRQSLLRRTSRDSHVSNKQEHGAKTSQKVYLQEEDLFLVIAGFRNSRMKILAYYIACISTLGLTYLALRWLPRWYIRVTGYQVPLDACDWVVVENQWHDINIVNLQKKSYNDYLSSVFESASLVAEEDDPYLEDIRYIDYRYIRFMWHPQAQKFVLYNNYKDPAWRASASVCREGLQEDSSDRRLALFGHNLIDIAEKNIGQLLVDEALHPFYIFQVASIILWSCDEYYYYAVCIFFISLISITSTVVETRDTMRRLREMARFECELRVLRNGFWQLVKSANLVPGDILELSDPSISILPCDALLMAGDCIVNESMLTGESVPVPKSAANDKSLHRLANSPVTVSAELGKHYLFAGTKMIQVKKPMGSNDGTDEEEVALAMVTRTGFNTTKGALVRSMLFPKPVGFKFYRDSFRFIGVMAIIAFCGFTISAVNFVKLGMHWSLILIRALDLVTIVVPPALPATLTIGTNFAIGRLRKYNIFCISPNRVNVAGKIDVMCFDKTGTLTEEGLDVLGVRQVVEHGFSPLIESSTSQEIQHDDMSMMHVMATCHSLRQIDHDLLGDPLDIKMFEFTDWSYNEDVQRHTDGHAHGGSRPRGGRELSYPTVVGLSVTGHKTEISIIKQFEFASQLRRMSVIVDSPAYRGMAIYLKGAPETMTEVCRVDSFPANYDEILASYTHRGYRVIACAGKFMPDLTNAKAHKLKRSEAERHLNFLGFIIFENKLKPGTAVSITALNEARIRNVMCTGDNLLTAISVARECQLLKDNAFVFVPRFKEEGGPTNPLQVILWEGLENPDISLDPTSLSPVINEAQINHESPYDKHGLSDYAIAMTGEVYRWMVDFAPRETLERALVKGVIFARMSPDEKAELVEKLQSIDHCVGFCGDGANDCGALKAADVGISLSEAEASVAAPFTSRDFDINCVLQLIKEGRAALVTSFSCFKYMALYSAIQFTTVSLLYQTASNLGDFQFLFIDLALILPIAIFMGRAQPYSVLSIKRPTANLVSRKIIGSLLGQILFIVASQTLLYYLVQTQSWYIPPTHHKNKPNIVGSDNTVLFLLSLYQYTFVAVVLSVGRPYRQPMYKNIWFMTTILLLTLFTLYITLQPSRALQHILQLTTISNSFIYIIIGIALLNFIISWLGETMVFTACIRCGTQIVRRLLSLRRKDRKRWKVVTEDLRL